MRRAALASLLLAVACFASAERPTLRGVCHRMTDCGGWGWRDVEECEEGLLSTGDYEASCASRDGYLDCMGGCMELPCDQFEICEFDCWESRCG